MSKNFDKRLAKIESSETPANKPIIVIKKWCIAGEAGYKGGNVRIEAINDGGEASLE